MADPDDHFEDDDCYPEPELVRCDACGGTGLAVEGWDCGECLGEGAFEL